MAMSRERGGSSVTSRPPIEIVPSVTSSRPAIIRRSVDLPHPDGPTRTRNSPLPIVSDTPSTAVTPPEKTLLTLSRTISATRTIVESIPHRATKSNGIDHFAASLYSRLHDGGRRSPAEDDEAERGAAAGARADRAARRRHRDSLRAAAQRGPRRLAPDRPRRARRPRARGLSRPSPRKRDVRAAAEDRPAAHDDLVQRGHAPARDGGEQQDALAHAPAGRPSSRALPQRLSRPGGRRRQAAAAGRRRLDGDRDAPHPGGRRAGRRAEGSRGLVLRAPARPVRDRDRDRDADDRADGDERGGVVGARRAAPLAGLPVRAYEPRRGRPDTRVRPLDLPGRPLPDRLRADTVVASPSPDLDKSGLVWEIPRVADWYRPLDAPLDVIRLPATDVSDAPLARRRLEGDLA